MTLEDLGWNDFFEQQFAAFKDSGLVPGRLIRDNKLTQGALTIGDDGKFAEHEVIVSGKVYHDAKTDAELPAVGDWVGLDFTDQSDFPVIRARLPRQTCLSRKSSGMSAEEQVIAANVNTVCIVTDAGPDFNERRLERYFAIIHRSGAQPVVIINKSDLCDAAQMEEATGLVQRLQPAASIHAVSARRRTGLAALREHIRPGQTIAFIGSSGVGKSALINRLLGGEYQETGEVDEGTGKGKHTTTARELMVLRKGGIIIDNPGIKEVQMWTDESTPRNQFSDIEEISHQCRFHDCKHGSDAGCAIRAAVESGELDEARYAGFLKLDEEIAELIRRRKKRQMTIERRQKRDHRVKARNLSDRRALEAELRPHRRHDKDDFA